MPTKSGVVRPSPRAISACAATEMAMCQWLVNVLWPGRSGKRSPCEHRETSFNASPAPAAENEEGSQVLRCSVPRGALNQGAYDPPPVSDCRMPKPGLGSRRKR